METGLTLDLLLRTVGLPTRVSMSACCDFRGFLLRFDGVYLLHCSSFLKFSWLLLIFLICLASNWNFWLSVSLLKTHEKLFDSIFYMDWLLSQRLEESRGLINVNGSDVLWGALLNSPVAQVILRQVRNPNYFRIAEQAGLITLRKWKKGTEGEREWGEGGKKGRREGERENTNK